jgi:HSP20 family protein
MTQTHLGIENPERGLEMSRQSLPQTQANSAESSFFPSFRREMNRFLDQFKTGFPIMDGAAETIFSGPSFPAVDVLETDDFFEISAEVPGVKEADLDVSIRGQVLIIKGEKSADHEAKEDNYHLIERRYGSFHRQIPLGFSPEDGAIDAKFSDGILKLHIKKPAAVKANVRKIDIKKS